MGDSSDYLPFARPTVGRVWAHQQLGNCTLGRSASANDPTSGTKRWQKGLPIAPTACCNMMVLKRWDKLRLSKNGGAIAALITWPSGVHQQGVTFNRAELKPSKHSQIVRQ